MSSLTASDVSKCIEKLLTASDVPNLKVTRLLNVIDNYAIMDEFSFGNSVLYIVVRTEGYSVSLVTNLICYNPVFEEVSNASQLLPTIIRLILENRNSIH